MMVLSLHKGLNRQIETSKERLMQNEPRWKALASGLVGATVLTVLHETARQKSDKAPHVHKLGMRAIAKMIEMTGRERPSDEQLYRWAMVGDLVSNSLYYSAVGNGEKNPWTRGALLGTSAGVGAVGLPGLLGLGSEPSNRTRETQIMTVAWYLVGGLAAAATAQLLASSDEE